jgi:hypothetical protein
LFGAPLLLLFEIIQVIEQFPEKNNDDQMSKLETETTCSRNVKEIDMSEKNGIIEPRLTVDTYRGVRTP